MENFSKLGVQELNSVEIIEVQGGIIFAIAAGAGIVFLTGEMAYMAGRAASGCDR